VTEGPLNGIRVIDCSSGTAGPRATGLLADYGAEVIWIEPPGGDEWRDRLAVPYSVFNRGKKSVTLDLADRGHRDELLGLIASADVFVESWAPGTAERLGLDPHLVHDSAPWLVWCSLTAFGDDGPHRDLPPYEALVHAVAGSMAEQVGMRDGPIYEALPFASIGASYLAVIGILSALYRANLDGIGRRVDTSMLDGALAYLAMLWGDADVEPPAHDPGSGRLVAKTVMCGDGEYMGIHTGAVGAFGRLMKVLGLDDRIPSAESGLDIGIPLTAGQRKLLDVNMHEIFATKVRDAWVELLTRADICAIPLLPPLDVFDEPQTLHNRIVVEVEDPLLGMVQQVGPPLELTATPGSVRGPAPRPGADTSEVLGAAEKKPVGFSTEVPGAERPVLEGLKILDLGAFFAGPYASRLLADLGADVIKLEPLNGDPIRGLEVVFRTAQAGKRSIACDLKSEEGQQIVSKLIEWADVVHHNMRPGAAERLGVGYEQCVEINPEVVYMHSPGWGSSGPAADLQSFAPMMSGYVGAHHEVAGRFNPPLWPIGNEDPGGGLAGACGMLMALVYRQRSGEGQLVEAPQLNATLTHMAHIVRRPDGEVLGASGLDPVQLGFSALDRLYETADGWICIVAMREAEIASLGGVMGMDLLSDPRFSTTASRQKNDDDLAELLMKVFAGRCTSELIETLRSKGVAAVEPVPHNRVNFLRDPENHRSGRAAECPDAARGKIRELAHLVRVSDCAVAPHKVAPGIGADTRQVLTQLGYSTRQIADMAAGGVIRGA